MTAQEWNDKYPVGKTVTLIEDNGDITRTKTRSIAWELCSGTAVVKVDGKTGGYDLDRITGVSE